MAANEDPRVTRTRELIERSFYDLLLEKKLDALTIGDIAKRARINRATFYAHFEDKYALYRHMVRTTFEQILYENLPQQSEEPGAELRALVRSACLFFEQLNAACPPPDRQTRPLVEVQIQTQLNEYVLLWTRRNLSGDPAFGTFPELAAKMISWAIFGAGLDWDGDGLSAEILSERIYTVIEGMLGQARIATSSGKSESQPTAAFPTQA